MDAQIRVSIEVNTLHGLLDELDYYRLLGLDNDCPQKDIEGAVRRENRGRHPDRVSPIGDKDLTKKANEIYQRVKEAGECLTDPDQRAQYDEVLKAGILRMTDEAVAMAEKERRKAENPEHAATHPKAEKFWKMALSDWTKKNYKGCVMNIQFAMNFEPDNEVMAEWLEKAKGAADKKAVKERNPYKLRIV
jgi:curved DNA-binding protein CbpA